MNAKVRNAVSADEIASFAQDLAVAKLQLQMAMAGADRDFDVWLRRAEAALKYAQTQYSGATAANARRPETINPIDVQRKRLRVEVAQLELERGQAAEGSPDREQAWRLSVIMTELQTLKEEVRETVPSSPIYPLWRY